MKSGNSVFALLFKAVAIADDCSCQRPRYRLIRTSTCQQCEYREELASAITHGIGLVFALIGAAILLVLVVAKASSWPIVAFSIYGLSLITLYAASTCYHAVSRPRVKKVLRIFDLSAIYVFIAGTYTPFTLISLRGPWGWGLFATVWALTLVGVIWQVRFSSRFPAISTTLYVLMGWIAVIAIKPIFAAIPIAGIMWLFAGGACYSVGVLFFACGRRVAYAHAVWHVFAIFGSVCHYLAVLYVPH